MLKRRHVEAAIKVLVAVIVILIVFWLLRPKPLFPKSVLNQVSFIILYPAPSTGYKVVSSTVKYVSSAKGIEFEAQSKDNKLTITEQSTPDPFNDIPQYYPAFIDKLNAYKSFDSPSGKVALTLPKELKGGQSAMLIGQGTLMFAHPAHNLTNDQWQRIFNNLYSIK